jgi:hypothetical protein
MSEKKFLNSNDVTMDEEEQRPIKIRGDFKLPSSDAFADSAKTTSNKTDII